MERVNAQFPTSDARPRYCFVDEAPGETETYTGVPLTGPPGKLFDQALRAAGIPREQCLVTNVLDFKLPNNDIKRVTAPRPDAPSGRFAPWADSSVAPGEYLPEQLIEEQLGRLCAEIERADPDVIVPMGGLACWALTACRAHGVIKKIRGAPCASKLVGVRSIPTFHPAFIVRSYHLYPMLLADFIKARKFAHGDLPDAKFDVWSVERPEQFDEFIARLAAPVSVDIETVKHSLIDCIGFSDDKAGFSVEIFDSRTFAPRWSEADEIDIRARICRFLESDTPKVFQNGGGYDLQMLWEVWKVPTRGYAHDTRILHRSLFPELPADLGSMTTLHTTMSAHKAAYKAAQDKRNG